jgi:hypothetical protein
MVSRTLLVEGSSTSSPDGGLPHAPVTPYHAIYMSDPATINPPITHTNFASGGETLADISKRVPLRQQRCGMDSRRRNTDRQLSGCREQPS